MLDNLNDKQLEAVKHKDGPLLILAGAGSGKTRVLTTRIANLIENEGVDPKSILAITFTNKAAGEMKERIYNLTKNSNVLACTFHSLGVRILRENYDKLGYKNTQISNVDLKSSLNASLHGIAIPYSSSPKRSSVSPGFIPNISLA